MCNVSCLVSIAITHLKILSEYFILNVDKKMKLQTFCFRFNIDGII